MIIIFLKLKSFCGATCESQKYQNPIIEYRHAMANWDSDKKYIMLLLKNHKFLLKA